MIDLRSQFSDSDYVDDVYVSIKNIGNKVFRKCAYFDNEDYILIWTRDDDFVIDKSEMGDCVVIPYDHRGIQTN